MWLFLVRASNSNECVKGLSDASLRSCDVTENRICIYYSRGAGAIKVLSVAVAITVAMSSVDYFLRALDKFFHLVTSA